MRSINDTFTQIGLWHDAGIDAKKRPDLLVSPLHPHKARHAAAYKLAKETKGDQQELERFLGHSSRKYLGLYTNPPEEIRAGYVEDF